MRMTKLVGRRIKEDTKDAKTISHKYLIRGGYIRPGFVIEKRRFLMKKIIVW